jgi:hypothetical protein
MRPILRFAPLLLAASLAWLVGSFAPAALAQAPSATAAGSAVPAAPAASPGLAGVKLDVPRPVKALTEALGPGRQRLALVLGQGKAGNRVVLDSASRDAQAVSALLRRMGFVVMVREDSTAAQLRLAVAEFREKLQPGGIGMIYATGLGTQIEGQNLLLARDATLDETAEPAKIAAAVRAASLPVSELAEALMTGLDSPRMLVVDAAYAHPALARLPAKGLGEMRLPPGLVALLGNGLNAVREVPAVAPLPDPPPEDPRQIAASGFARVFVATASTPRLSGPQTLRVVRRALHEGSAGQWSPWLGGEGNDKEELAEATLLDALFPRTPEEWARELAKKGAQSALRNAGGPGMAVRPGEQAVGEVLRQPVAGGNSSPVGPATPETPSNATRNASPGGEGPAEPNDPMSRRPRPGLGETAQQAGSAASNVGKALTTAASVGGTVASVAAGVAGTAVVAKAVEASAAVSAAQAAVGTVTSLASNAAALASRLIPTGGGTTGTASAAAESTSATAVRASSAVGQASRVAAATPTLPAAAPAAPVAPAAPAAVTVAPPPVAAAAAPAPMAATAAPTAPAAPTPGVPAAAPPAGMPAANAGTVPQQAPPAGATSASTAAARPANAAAPAAGRAGEQSVADILNQAPPNAGTAAAAAEGARRSPTGPAPTDGRTTRQAEGGERPAWHPRTNRFGHAEGDTLSWQVTDTWKGETRETFVASIEEVLSDGQILANGQQLQMDAQGRHKLRRGRDGSESRFEPHEDLWWADAKRGQSRDLAYTETFRRADGVRGTTEWKGSAKVGAPRTLETPAGSFEVLPIESSGWATETLANGLRTQTKFSRTVWYSPKLGHPVAIDLHDADRVGKMLRRERVELVHQQTQRLTTP